MPGKPAFWRTQLRPIWVVKRLQVLCHRLTLVRVAHTGCIAAYGAQESVDEGSVVTHGRAEIQVF